MAHSKPFYRHCILTVLQRVYSFPLVIITLSSAEYQRTPSSTRTCSIFIRITSDLP